MNKKQYRTALIALLIVSILVVAVNYIIHFTDNWFLMFMIFFIVYMYIRYKVSAPLQMFAKKFNMLIDYDLKVEEALEMAKRELDRAPTEAVRQLLMIYYGMGLYYNGEYNEAINTFNQIELKKVQNIYHALIFAFIGYSAYELEDAEMLEYSITNLENLKSHVGRKYFNFVLGYETVLKAIKNIEIDPEGYREVIERNYNREDGYISTKLIYNYRMARYYQVLNNTEEMDKCLAAVIANGGNHHTAIKAKELFKNTCNINDFVFSDSNEDSMDSVETVDEQEPLQIETIESDKITNLEEVSSAEKMLAVEDVFEEVEFSNKTVSELKQLCKDKGIKGYSKLTKEELVSKLKNIKK